MIVSGFEPTVIVANCLLQMYIKCSPLECALEVFDKIPVRDCVSWNTMMFGCSVNGKMELARSLFDLMPQRDLISWSSLISGYLQNGNCLNAVELFVMMGRDSVAYNETTLSVVSKAIASLEDAVLGHQMHGVAVKIGFDCQVVTEKCKMLDEARRIFDAMRMKNYISWSAIIACFVQNSELKGGLALFKKMQRENVRKVSLMPRRFSSCFQPMTWNLMLH